MTCNHCGKVIASQPQATINDETENVEVTLVCQNCDTSYFGLICIKDLIIE